MTEDNEIFAFFIVTATLVIVNSGYFYVLISISFQDVVVNGKNGYFQISIFLEEDVIEVEVVRNVYLAVFLHGINL